LLSAQVAVLTMFTLITLYSPIIPISLYVSVEVDYVSFHCILFCCFAEFLSNIPSALVLFSVLHFQMIKFVQSNKFINNDLHMYHAESNTAAQARTSNLNEELGQVNI